MRWHTNLLEDMNEENTFVRKKVIINEVTEDLELPSENDRFQNGWNFDVRKIFFGERKII
jgi:hypothetical protein